MTGNSRKSHLAVVVNDFQPYGAQRVAVATAAGLRRYFDRVSLVGLERPGSIDLPAVTGVGRASLNRENSGGSGYVELVLKLRQWLLGEGVTHILTHMMFANLVSLGAVRSSRRLRAAPVVAVDHSPPSMSISLERSQKALRLLGLVLYPYASSVVGVSDAVCADVAKTYRLRECPVRIYNPIDSDVIWSLASAEPPHPWLAVPESRTTLVCVGGFRPVKQQSLLLRALARLPDKRLLLVGDGPERSNLERLAESLCLRERVDFVGYRSDADERYSRLLAQSPFSRRPQFVSPEIQNDKLVIESSGRRVTVEPETWPGLADALVRIHFEYAPPKVQRPSSRVG